MGTLSPLTAPTLRYLLMVPVRLIALSSTGGYRELATGDRRTLAAIVLPAAMALGSLTLSFTALKGGLLSRVFPLTELGPAIAFILAALLLGEPWSMPRLVSTLLIAAGIVLVR